jgi:serine/threonine protein kinase
MYPRRYGNYVLLERLDVGGMSELDLARRVVEDANFVRFLVIKRIKADRNEEVSFVRMFKDEARISAQLHHTNIAQVYDFGKEGADYYLVLEYVPGLDARKINNVLRQRRQVAPLPIVTRIIADVLSGLQHAHCATDAQGRPMQVIHRDVNPKNILVGFRGEVKLIDFGVAKAIDRLERTETDHVKGKFAYMAPEQVSGAAEIDHRVDLFATGLTLHELLCGVHPFHGLNQMQIIHKLSSGQVPELPAPPGVPDVAALRAVHRRALAPRPEDRYSDAAAFRDALLAAAGRAATADEVVVFLRSLDPNLEGRLREKMATYARASFSDETITAEDPTVVPEQQEEPLGADPLLVASPPAANQRWMLLAGAGMAVVGLASLALSLLIAVAAIVFSAG